MSYGSWLPPACGRMPGWDTIKSLKVLQGWAGHVTALTAWSLLWLASGETFLTAMVTCWWVVWGWRAIQWLSPTASPLTRIILQQTGLDSGQQLVKCLLTCLRMPWWLQWSNLILHIGGRYEAILDLLFCIIAIFLQSTYLFWEPHPFCCYNLVLDIIPIYFLLSNLIGCFCRQVTGCTWHWRWLLFAVGFKSKWGGVGGFCTSVLVFAKWVKTKWKTPAWGCWNVCGDVATNQTAQHSSMVRGDKAYGRLVGRHKSVLYFVLWFNTKI